MVKHGGVQTANKMKQKKRSDVGAQRGCGWGPRYDAELTTAVYMKVDVEALRKRVSACAVRRNSGGYLRPRKQQVKEKVYIDMFIYSII
jgi:hypothetical protein